MYQLHTEKQRKYFAEAIRLHYKEGYGSDRTSIDEVIAAVAVAVDFYNNRRPHMSIGMMKPSEAINLTGERDMKWTSYRQMATKTSNKAPIPEYPLLMDPCQGFPSVLRPPVNP